MLCILIQFGRLPALLHLVMSTVVEETNLWVLYLLSCMCWIATSLLWSELPIIRCLAGIPDRFVNKRECLTLHKWIPYSTVVSAGWHNMGCNNWFFCLWMASWRTHTPKGLWKGWLIFSWEFVILKGKSFFRGISTCKHEICLLLSNHISCIWRYRITSIFCLGHCKVPLFNSWGIFRILVSLAHSWHHNYNIEVNFC